MDIMKNIELYIKNMVCSRCIATVQYILNDLNINYISINLGIVSLKDEINSTNRDLLIERLSNVGFELLEDNKSKLISQIKSILIKNIHHEVKDIHINYSVILSETLNHEYTYLSKLFSSIEGLTIERYIIKQKIEKVKELIFYKEYTLSEIAFKLNYSSVAHLSAQFKKETGMSPSEFKKLNKPTHRRLDSI